MGPTSNLHPRSTIDKVIICHKDLVINMLSDHVEFPLDGDGQRLVNRSESVQVEGYSKILDLFRCCGGSLKLLGGFHMWMKSMRGTTYRDLTMVCTYRCTVRLTCTFQDLSLSRIKRRLE